MRLSHINILLLASACGGLAAPQASAQDNTQEREWSLDAADADAFLVFGVPETDDVGVSLWCKIGSGKVKLFFPEGSATLKPDTTADYTIIINDKPQALKGSTSVNEKTGATSIETEMTVDDPLLVALQKADRFAVTIGTHTTTFPLIDAGLENLYRLCRTK